jgi:hypothetical protein
MKEKIEQSLTDLVLMLLEWDEVNVILPYNTA